MTEKRKNDGNDAAQQAAQEHLEEMINDATLSGCIGNIAIYVGRWIYVALVYGLMIQFAWNQTAIYFEAREIPLSLAAIIALVVRNMMTRVTATDMRDLELTDDVHKRNADITSFILPVLIYGMIRVVAFFLL